MFINVSGEPHPFQESITIPEEADVILECYGSGDLQWTASNGQEIPTRDSESRNIYQIHVNSRDVQVLQIRNFSRNSNAAGYTCTTDLTTQRGASVEITVTLHGGMCTMHYYMVPHVLPCSHKFVSPGLRNAFKWCRV